MQAWSLSDTGLVREQNQDYCDIVRFSDEQLLTIVCDGMGGARAGNVASRLAVDTFLDTARERSVDQWRADPEALLNFGAEQANQAVHFRAGIDAECRGMGTTMVAVLVIGEMAYLLNIGDSRAYHITKQAIRRITRDHSVVEDLVAKGDLTPEQARNHPQKNLITRALGTARRVKADLFQETVAEGDYLLLCSDGLINEVTDQEIHREVLAGGTPQEICQRLMTRTWDSGAPDNVTVVLFQL